MFKLFQPLKIFFLNYTSVLTDNFVFRLHYKFTIGFLITVSLILSAKQYIGEPIHCLRFKIDKELINEKLLNTYCWVHSTFSVEEAWRLEVGALGEVPYPGVSRYNKTMTAVYHSYYQWVPFVLMFQAFLFYLPRYYWKSVERGLVKKLVMDLNSPVLTPEVKTQNRGLLVECLYATLYHHNSMYASYVIAEMMNLGNVIGQMFLMQCFLGGLFATYGLEVLGFQGWSRAISYNPMVKVFPTMTKCQFLNFGSSSTIELRDVLCVLPINIFNQKVYLFLWFWFLFLAALSAIVLVYRAFVFALPYLRIKVILFHSRLVDRDRLECVVEQCMIGDWMLISLLSKNLDSVNFKDLIFDLSRKFEREHDKQSSRNDPF